MHFSDLDCSLDRIRAETGSVNKLHDRNNDRNNSAANPASTVSVRFPDRKPSWLPEND